MNKQKKLLMVFGLLIIAIVASVVVLFALISNSNNTSFDVAFLQYKDREDEAVASSSVIDEEKEYRLELFKTMGADEGMNRNSGMLSILGNWRNSDNVIIYDNADFGFRFKVPDNFNIRSGNDAIYVSYLGEYTAPGSAGDMDTISLLIKSKPEVVYSEINDNNPPAYPEIMINNSAFSEKVFQFEMDYEYDVQTFNAKNGTELAFGYGYSRYMDENLEGIDSPEYVIEDKIVYQQLLQEILDTVEVY